MHIIEKIKLFQLNKYDQCAFQTPLWSTGKTNKVYRFCNLISEDVFLLLILMVLVTVCKRSLGQGNMFTGVCLPTGVVPGPGGCLALGGPGLGGAWWRPPQTATAVGGMHPTGMHSC